MSVRKCVLCLGVSLFVLTNNFSKSRRIFTHIVPLQETFFFQYTCFAFASTNITNFVDRTKLVM